MNPKICQTCIYGLRGSRSSVRECHHDPPQIVGRTPDGQAIGGWPEVPAKEWCGQWMAYRAPQKMKKGFQAYA